MMSSEDRQIEEGQDGSNKDECREVEVKGERGGWTSKLNIFYG